MRVVSENSGDGNQTSVLNETQNYIETMAMHTEEPVEKVNVEKMGAIKMIDVTEADGDTLTLMDVAEFKDPSDLEFH